MRERIVAFFREIIYHPVNARITYDLAIAFVSSSFSYAIFSFNNIQIVHILLFSFFFIATNFILGIYSTLKLASSFLKFLSLLSSSIFSFVFTFLLGGSPIPLLNASIFAGILTGLPRIFLNFSSSTKITPFNQVVTSNSPVLVVGGGGYIGSVLVEKMIKSNTRVRVFDKFIYGKQVFDDLKDDRRLEIVEGDVTDIYALTLALRNVQAVVHLAGIVGDPASMIDDRLTRHMNIVSTRMLKEAVKAFRIPKFLFASSCSVYGTSEKIVNEKSRLNPLSAYAKTKIDSEREILQDTFDDFHPTILRFATVFGHSRKPRFDLVFNLFLAQAYNNGFITVTGENQWRPFISISDLAGAIIKILEAPKEKISRQIYNIGDNSLHATIGEIAKIAQRIVGEEKKVQIFLRKDDMDLRNYRVSFNKFQELFNFRCKVSLDDGAREIFEHFKKGTYKKPYTDIYYSALETTKEVKREFYSESYKKTHFSDLSFKE